MASGAPDESGARDSPPGAAVGSTPAAGRRTDRRTPQEVAASEELFRSSMQAASIGICLVAPDGRFLEVNQALCALLDRDPKSLSEMTWQDVTHPDDADIGPDQVAAVISGQLDTFRVRKRYLRRDGSVVHGDLSVGCVRNADGSVRHLIGQITDISEQVRAEEALAQSEARYRLLAENAADAVFAATADAAYTWVSPSVTDLLGWRPEELYGKRPTDLCHPDDLEGVLRSVADVGGGGAINVRSRLRTASGGYRWLTVNAQPLFDESGVLVARMGAYRDAEADVAAEEALSAERQLLQAVLDSALEPHVYLRAERDESGTIIDFTYGLANPAACSYLGFDRERLEGARVLDVFPGRVGPDLLALFAQAMSTQQPLVLDDYPYSPDTARRARRFDIRGVRVGDGLSLGWRDVTDRFDAAQRLASSEERFRTAMTSAPIGMALTRLDRSFQEVNQALCAILQRPEDWLLEHSVADLVDAESDQIDRELRDRVLNGPGDHTTAEHQMILPGGQLIWVDHSVAVLRDAKGAPTGFVSQFVDITEERYARERMRFMASHDSLTNLINRRTFIDGISDLLRHRPRTGANVAVLFIDLDNLKPINDEFGHAAGDAVLAEAARRLRQAVRSDDLVARIGGDEFVVALTTIRTPEDAADVAAKIHLRVAVPVLVDGRGIPLSISIGVAIAQPGEDPSRALQRADDALYQAKQQGRGRTAIDPGALGAG